MGGGHWGGIKVIEDSRVHVPTSQKQGHRYSWFQFCRTRLAPVVSKGQTAHHCHHLIEHERKKSKWLQVGSQKEVMESLVWGKTRFLKFKPIFLLVSKQSTFMSSMNFVARVTGAKWYSKKAWWFLEWDGQGQSSQPPSPWDTEFDFWFKKKKTWPTVFWNVNEKIAISKLQAVFSVVSKELVLPGLIKTSCVMWRAQCHVKMQRYRL